MEEPASNGYGPLFNTTLARLYKESESGSWKESQSLGCGVAGFQCDALSGADGRPTLPIGRLPCPQKSASESLILLA